MRPLRPRRASDREQRPVTGSTLSAPIESLAMDNVGSGLAMRRYSNVVATMPRIINRRAKRTPKDNRISDLRQERRARARGILLGGRVGPTVVECCHHGFRVCAVDASCFERARLAEGVEFSALSLSQFCASSARRRTDAIMWASGLAALGSSP